MAYFYHYPSLDLECILQHSAGCVDIMLLEHKICIIYLQPKIKCGMIISNNLFLHALPGTFFRST